MRNLKNVVLLGDSLEVLKDAPSDYFQAVVTDPPYGLGTKEPTGPEIDAYLAGTAGIDTGGDFMGKNWSLPSVALWREVYRTLKPGAVVMAFAGTRTLDLMAAGIEAAGFRYVGCLGWVHCLTEDAEILTEYGWEPIYATIEGSRVMCYDVEHDTFSWQPALKQYLYPYEGDVYRLRGENTDHVVTPEHRCLTLGVNGKYGFQRAHELAETAQVPVVQHLHGLLDELRGHGRSDGEEQNVFSRVCEGSYRTGTSEAKGGQEPGHLYGEGASNVLRVRQGLLPIPSVGQEVQAPLLLQVMCEQGTGAGTSTPCPQGERGSNGGRQGSLVGSDDGSAQSCLEGRGDVLLEARELRVGEIRSVPARVPSDGSEGRVRRGASTRSGASLGSMSFADGSGASLEPRPHGQPFRELGALCVESGPQVVRASRYTRPDLVRVTREHYTGLIGCVTTPTGTFVARQNGKVFVTGNSQGFPKSRDLFRLEIQPEVEKQLRAQGVTGEIRWRG